jgi:hypothetical protein
MLAAVALLAPSLLFWPPYRLTGWIAGRFTDEGDQTATLKLLSGVFLYPLWTALLAVAAGRQWGWGTALALPLALLIVGMGWPVLERAKEDLQSIRGFLRRRDPVVPELLEARKQLLAAFPELRS